MSLKELAKQTISILEQGYFINSEGTAVSIKDELLFAKKNTRLYRPDILEKMLTQTSKGLNSECRIEVTDEKTQTAACRLVQKEDKKNVVLLNFASAKNAGGGFINGAKAQEEDLSRCSGLYECLITVPEYYKVNRATGSMLYTDHMIYSKDVPWFRSNNRDILEQSFVASVITAPAPNAGQCKLKRQHSQKKIDSTLLKRAGMVLAVAKENGHTTLILGAWGCGVFRNSPKSVAEAFKYWLKSDTFKGCFEYVLFAVYDPSKSKDTFNTFNTVLNE